MRAARTRDDDGRDRMNEGTTARTRTRGMGQRSRRATTVPWAHALNLPRILCERRGYFSFILFFTLLFLFFTAQFVIYIFYFKVV
jgi:hypothetical protein